MRRLATAILLFGPIVLVALLPLRPLLIAVWPVPVEELVTEDGDWLLIPIIGDQTGPDNTVVKARTRPLSLIELETVNGERVHGYLIDRMALASDEEALTIQTGPEELRVIPSSELALLLYPNDMSLADRLKTALGRIQNRHPIS